MASGREYVVDISSRESSFDPPSYAISHGKDYTLQWEPPAGSKDLAVALSYHFPLETSMESKMRAATKKFLKEEKRKQSKISVPSTALAPVEEITEEDTAFRTLASDLVSQRQSESSNDNEVAVLSADTLGALQEPQLSSPRTDEEKKPATTEPLQDVTVVANSSKEGTLASTTIQQEPEHENTRHNTIEQTVSVNGSGVASTKVHPSDATLPATVEQSTDSRTGPGDAAPQPLSWVNGLELKEVKRMKRRYGMIEAAKVAANRGNACDEHRKRKVKCDPDSCPSNGLRSYQNRKLSREIILVQTNTPQIEPRAVSSVTGTKATEGDLVTDFPPAINTSLGTSEPHDRSIAPNLLENSPNNDSAFVFGLGSTPLQAPSGNAIDFSKRIHQINTDDAVPSAITHDDWPESFSGPFDPLQYSNEFPGWPTDQAVFGSGWGSGWPPGSTYMDDQFATDVPDTPYESCRGYGNPTPTYLPILGFARDDTDRVSLCCGSGADALCSFELGAAEIHRGLFRKQPRRRTFSLWRAKVANIVDTHIVDGLSTHFADLSLWYVRQRRKLQQISQHPEVEGVPKQTSKAGEASLKE